MDKIWLNALISTIAVSIISLIGVSLFALKTEKLQKMDWVKIYMEKERAQTAASILLHLMMAFLFMT